MLGTNSLKKKKNAEGGTSKKDQKRVNAVMRALPYIVRVTERQGRESLGFGCRQTWVEHQLSLDQMHDYSTR